MVGNRPQNSPLEAEEIWDKIELNGATLPIIGAKYPISRGVLKDI